MSKLVLIEVEELESIIDRKLSKYLSRNEQTSFQQESKILHSIKELAQFLNCSIVTAQKLKNSGKIPFVQYGRKIQFEAAAVLSALEKNKSQLKKK